MRRPATVMSMAKTGTWEPCGHVDAQEEHMTFMLEKSHSSKIKQNNKTTTKQTKLQNQNQQLSLKFYGLDSVVFPSESTLSVFRNDELPSETHFSLDLLSALSCKTLFSSNKAYRPSCSARRRTSPSILLVRQSASIALLLIQRSLQFSSRRSRMSKHSRVVLYSEQAGVEVFVERSYTDLQSVATTGLRCLS